MVLLGGGKLMENDMEAVYEQRLKELQMENIGLMKELDLLNSKIDLIANVYKIIKIMDKAQEDTIPSEIESILDEFFRLTTFKTKAEVKNGK